MIQQIVGTSGAIIVLHKTHVVKFAPRGAIQQVGDRIEAQARFMGMLGDKVCPKVFTTFPGGFTMERCEQPNHGIKLEYAMWRALGVLSANVWTPVKTSPPWLDMHRLYITPRINRYTPEHLEAMTRAMEQVANETVAEDWSGLIHGDPTFDNLLVRKGHYIITDPLPPSAGMPPLRTVDIAKVMQSLLGYEEIKYRGKVSFIRSKRDPWEVGDSIIPLSAREWYAVRYFTAVHLVRLLPYQEHGTRQTFKDVLASVVAGL